MPINTSDYICFDFETGNKISDIAPVLQIGAVVLRGDNLEMKSDTFLSYCKPEPDEMQYVEDEALKVNHIERGQIDGFPAVSEVFKSFAAWINKYNFKKNSWGSPIPMGYNIRSYDLPIFNRLCKRYGFVDKDGKQNLFSNFVAYDLMDIVRFYLDGSSEPKNIKLDTIREHFGLKTEGQNHSALKDAKDVAIMYQRFIKFARNTAKSKNYFKGTFSE